MTIINLGAYTQKLKAKFNFFLRKKKEQMTTDYGALKYLALQVMATKAYEFMSRPPSIPSFLLRSFFASAHHITIVRCLKQMFVIFIRSQEFHKQSFESLGSSTMVQTYLQR